MKSKEDRSYLDSFQRKKVLGRAVRMKRRLKNRWRGKFGWAGVLLLVASLLSGWQLRFQVSNFVESSHRKIKLLICPTKSCHQDLKAFLISQNHCKWQWNSLQWGHVAYPSFSQFSTDPLPHPLPKNQWRSFTSLSNFRVFRKLLFHIFKPFTTTTTPRNVFFMCSFESRTLSLASLGLVSLGLRKYDRYW